jgi:hypothetical protein
MMKKQTIISVLILALAMLAWKGNAQNLNDFTIQVAVNSDIDNPEIKNVVLHILYDASNFNEEMIDTTIIDSVEVLSIITPIPDNLSEISIFIKDTSSQLVNSTVTVIDLINGNNFKIGYNKIVIPLGTLSFDTYQMEVYIKDEQNIQSETKVKEFIVY